MFPFLLSSIKCTSYVYLILKIEKYLEFLALSSELDAIGSKPGESQQWKSMRMPLPVRIAAAVNNPLWTVCESTPCATHRISEYFASNAGKRKAMAKAASPV